MKTEIKKVQTITIPLKPEPGALTRIFSAFNEANVNVIAHWAYEMGPGQAEVVIYPTDLPKTQTVLTKLGFKPTLGWACYAESDDKLGSYAEILAKVAKANVNLTASDAFAIKDRYASMFFAKTEHLPELYKALGV